MDQRSKLASAEALSLSFSLEAISGRSSPRQTEVLGQMHRASSESPWRAEPHRKGVRAFVAGCDQWSKLAFAGKHAAQPSSNMHPRCGARPMRSRPPQQAARRRVFPRCASRRDRGGALRRGAARVRPDGPSESNAEASARSARSPGRLGRTPSPPPSCPSLLRGLISGGLRGVQREALPAAARRRACAACGRGLGLQTLDSNQGCAGFCSSEDCGTEGRSEGKGGGCSGDEPTDEGTQNAAQSGIKAAEHSKACPPSQQG